jgi:hypothetical protein
MNEQNVAVTHQALNRRNAKTDIKSAEDIFGAEDSTMTSIADDFKGGLGFVLDDCGSFEWLDEGSVEARFFFPIL